MVVKDYTVKLNGIDYECTFEVYFDGEPEESDTGLASVQWIDELELLEVSDWRGDKIEYSEKDIQNRIIELQDDIIKKYYKSNK